MLTHHCCFGHFLPLSAHAWRASCVQQFKAEVEIAQRDAEIAQLKELAQQAGQTIVYHTGIDALSDVVGEQSCLGERSHVSDIFVN